MRRSETWRRNANRLRETGRPGSFGVRVGTSVRDNHDAATANSTTATARPTPGVRRPTPPGILIVPPTPTPKPPALTATLGGCYSDTAATTPLQRVLAAPLPAWVESGAAFITGVPPVAVSKLNNEGWRVWLAPGPTRRVRGDASSQTLHG